MIRAMIHSVSYAAIHLLKPIKVFAYQTRFQSVKGLILEATTLIDFSMIFFNIQNNTMLLHQKAYDGNFIFGKSVAVTDHATTTEAIAKPLFKCNHFMGVDIVASDSSVFAVNSGILNQCPALRESTREAIDKNLLTDTVRSMSYEAISASCKEIVDEWSQNPEMSTMFAIRGTATRIFLKLLNGKTVSSEDAHAATKNYVLHFGAISAFGRYLPSVNGILGSYKHLRKDSYFMLRDKYDLDIEAIGTTLFAAQFSVGTLVIQCVEYIQKFGIRYQELDYQKKRNFITEAVRLWPTVTSVHRIVERDEVIRIGKNELKLTAGDEVIYPFACSNRDSGAFREPEKMDLDRPKHEYDAVLSWSKGPHSCPGKGLSINVTLLMLDRLAERHDLSKLKIFNLTF